eukprot:TRINITY_DN7139_c0_g1_i1.p1 TRINITY_DN7139_c0_g1~~TRINITY_DN7139_c0_g1_i1.p1  ORF type:complete len:1095 (+),score=184.92 TRINITY_DN7139_c0_g1_i1:189-3473(+)
MDALSRTMRKMSGQEEDLDMPMQVLPRAHPSIRKLMAGNARYVRKGPQGASELDKAAEGALRRKLSTIGQAPWAIVVSCSDSRCPVERLFDTGPGELFVVRVAGNICSPGGGVIGSAEYGVEHLKSPVLLVLGHTKCGAVNAAVRCSKDSIVPCDHFGQNLGSVVGSIESPAFEALQSLERPETPDQVEHAIKLNVYNSMEQLLKYSTVIQQAVRHEDLELHGGIYDIMTGEVSLLGQHPRQEALVSVPHSLSVRTGVNAPMLASEVLMKLQSGNERFARGNLEHKTIDAKTRHALVKEGQRPMAVMLGCADSRVPLDYVFDANPGDLFVVRNAGSVCGGMEGGLIGSIEYGVGHLKTRFLMVLGHTLCGAVAAAMEAHLASEKSGEGVPDGLRCLLERLQTPVKMAVEQSTSSVLADRVSLAIELNVWHTIEQLLASSSVLQKAVESGDLQIHGGIYDMQSGRVRFMGQHPQMHKLVSDVVAPVAEIEVGGFDEIPGQVDDSISKLKKASKVSSDKHKSDQQFAPAGVVPDVESGIRQRSSPALSDEKNQAASSDGESGGSWFEFSWYVNTKHGRQHLKDVVTDQNNWIAGVTVAFVSVPLSIALGIASGTTPMRGVSAAVFGGLCSGFFGSSDYNIVGPAGALSGMLMSYSVQWGDDVLPWLSLISAAICLVCAVLRLDTYMLLMPKSVFEGFTVGVALIIGLNQINFACGLTPGKKHKLFVMNIVESIMTLEETKWASLIVFLLQAPILWLLMRKIPKIPWTVILPTVSIGLGLLCEYDLLGFDLLTLKSKYGILEPELVVPLKQSGATFLEMLVPSFSIAIVAVLETLISAKIAAGRVDCDFNELNEMRGLIVGHAVCGAVGAMPPTGVFVRTSLNTTLGATHRFSQVLNAVVVAIISLALMPVFSYLPQATIAAILVVAAVRMCPMSYLKKLWYEDKSELAICLVTAAICVGEDPVIGLAIGMVLALLLSAKTMLQAPFVDVRSRPSGLNGKRSYEVKLNSAITYVNAEAFERKVRRLEEASEVSLDLKGVRQLDHDGVCMLGKVTDAWMKSQPDCKVWIKGVTERIYPTLSKVAWFTKAEDAGRVQMA